MRIAVIADTHDRLPTSLYGPLAEADEIWHLGDVCSPVILKNLRQLGPPVRVVRGNCDSCQEWPEIVDLTVEGFHIRLIHIPPKKVEATFDLLLHGHTHVPRYEFVGSTRFLNPGCITRPNRGAPPSYAWLELKSGDAPRWSLQTL